MKELVLSKYERKSNYTAEAVMQTTLNIKKYREAERTEKADILI